MADVFVHRFRPTTVLRARGEDAASFLQGQFSRDLRPWAKGRTTYGLWLSVKGKVEGDSWVIQRDDREFLVLSVDTPAGPLRERLERFTIADDVTFADETADWHAATLLGPGTGAALAARGMGPPTAGQSWAVDRADARVLVFAGRRGEPAWEVWWRGADPLASVPAEPIAAEELERRRIAAGVPRVPIDIGPSDLPQEGGLEREAVSFDKGCYLGQEVMARLHAMGQVRRTLVRVRSEGSAPSALPQPLLHEGRTVGEVRSAARAGDHGWIGLALVQRTAAAGPWTLGGVPGPVAHRWAPEPAGGAT